MSIPTRSIRSIQDIRTLEGWGDLAKQPYRAFMKITCLEMEKARRTKERESALLRVRNIDDRLREIEIEKESLMKVLGMPDSGGSGPGPAPVSARGGEGFRFRY
jgi:hypothetical protein